MAVVAGLIFFFIRAFFALIPGLADKKMGGLRRLDSDGLLSRAFLQSGRNATLVLMIAVVLLGVSFAATLALVAGYERGTMNADSSLGARAALWGVNEIVGLTVASLLAGAATTPYAAYHFHRIAPFSVLANLLAMPIVSAWVMPMGILGVLAMPFGLDAKFWRQMGYGIEWMDAVGLWVASLPRSAG